jgi:hypothetical protein
MKKFDVFMGLLVAFFLGIIVLIIGIIVNAALSYKPPTTLLKTTNHFYYTIEVIDKCQYIRFDRGLTHKGNCTNHALIMLNLPPFPTTPNIKVEWDNK